MCLRGIDDNDEYEIGFCSQLSWAICNDQTVITSRVFYVSTDIANDDALSFLLQIQGDGHTHRTSANNTNSFYSFHN